MARIYKIEGLERVVAALRAKTVRANKERHVEGIVGYTAAYALYVHEILTANHPQGEAKFLERPFRELRDELMTQVRADYQRGLPLAQCILRACLRLQRESQLRVPVDTGALRASAFTRLE